MEKLNFSGHCLPATLSLYLVYRRLAGEVECKKKEQCDRRSNSETQRCRHVDKSIQWRGDTRWEGQGIINWLLCVVVIGGPNCERPSIHFSSTHFLTSSHFPDIVLLHRDRREIDKWSFRIKRIKSMEKNTFVFVVYLLFVKININYNDFQFHKRVLSACDMLLYAKISEIADVSL